MEIDLGDAVKANIKVSGESYKMSLPTALEANEYVEKLKDNEGKEVKIFMSLVKNLGLPEDVVKKLTMLQLTKLGEGLLGSAKKK